ncbi:hypothetical protein B5F90_06460 [Alistipes sp. An31A]|uniref:DUF2971 domain-containing protein n=1 Tax=Alistipes sp. An31A TaxID=1965631 RepID=UPI000B3AD12D|nr:DUF2971 domain-containing protein [Alistipes sp. An31A]OUO21109.1 hypothetical protein B5F90_06460 [Alistipes sp. An31A]
MAELYHYTTGAGLLGMLKDYDAEKNPNLTMWATHYAYMNDPTELEFGIEICLPLIKEIEEEDGVPEDEKIYPFLKEAKELPKYWGILEFKHWEFQGVLNPCMISFSQAKDSLHMWNMYGQNGNGLALCFDMNSMRGFKTDYSFDSCIYISNNIPKDHKEKLKQKIRVFYKNKCDLFRGMRSSLEMNEKYKIGLTFMVAPFIYAGVASYLKHEAYKDEQEFRMLVNERANFRFRERNGEIIPYREEKIPFEYLRNIFVGPTRDFERTRNSILLLLGQKGIFWSPDKIIKSNVPYRG